MGMPGKRSAASSVHLLDKVKETLAWINPVLSLFTDVARCINGLRMKRDWRRTVLSN